MIRDFIASLRLAFALVCVGVSLILGGQWLGMIPDVNELEMRARRNLCETIAINASAHIRRQQWVDLKTIMRSQVERNEDLLSIGLRSDMGTLRLDTGQHASVWPAADQADDRVEAIRVPITLNRRPWGDVEFCFQRPEVGTLMLFSQHSIYRLVGFFVVAGLASYTLFVARIMGVFRNTQVVPDRVRQALDTLAEGLLVLDEAGRIVLANRAFADTVSIPADRLARSVASELSWIFPEGPQPTAAFPWISAINEGKLQPERMLEYQLADGRKRIFSVNAAPLGSDRDRRGALATFRDVTHIEEHRQELESMLGMLRRSRDEIERKNGELEILATTDALTGCLNRRAFFEQFEVLWREARASNTPLSCLMIDNDHFKQVNDTYGHHIGDEVLRRVSSVIRENFRQTGVVCRFGGEEFCVALPKLTLAQAIDEAEKARIAINQIVFDEPAELKLSASLGVSELRFKAADPQGMINQADACLYVAKREGRNRVIAFNKQIAMTADSDVDQSEHVKKRTLDISYQAVTALMTALSYRDAKTAEHSRRVADLCARAASGALDPAYVYLLEVAAMLHDIGKIGVPDHILLKPGPLNDDEWAIMNRHDRIGVEIVASAFECEELTAIISVHHRCLQPTEGKVGTCAESISKWCGNLLTIADCYDAMVSDRVYRKGCSHESAAIELRRCAGTQFDPHLVEHFINAIENRCSTLTAGAFGLGKRAAIQIGVDLEKLADAIECQDLQKLKEHVTCLALTANSCGIESISQAANHLQTVTASEAVQWTAVLKDTNELLDACRGVQAELLRESLGFETTSTQGPKES